MDRLYQPQFVVPKIQQTSFRDPEAMAELTKIIRLLVGGSLTGQCWIPLGVQQLQIQSYPLCSPPPSP